MILPPKELAGKEIDGKGNKEPGGDILGRD